MGLNNFTLPGQAYLHLAAGARMSGVMTSHWIERLHHRAGDSGAAALSDRSAEAREASRANETQLR